MVQIEILEYQTSEGQVPFREWLHAFRDVNTRARIRTRMDRLQLGNFGDCESVGGGVFELRMHFGPGYRIYFGQASRRTVILLSGGDKSSQRQDIRRVQEYWQDYKRRSQ